MKKVAVIGGGLVGSLEAIYLAQRGYQVDVLERRPDIRAQGAAGGRSINLALSDRGWRALEGAGIADDIARMAIPMKGRMMHYQNGEQTFQPYGQEGQAIYSVSRGGLNQRMIEKADEYENVRFHFRHKCTDIDLDTASVRFLDENKDNRGHSDHDWIIGTDGAFSAVRLRMQKTDRFDYSQEHLKHGYKELSIPPGGNGEHLLEKHALHIWPRGRYMMIALPNLDGSFTCTLFLPFKGEPSFASLQTSEEVQAFMKETFPDAVPLMPTLLEDYEENPTASLVTIRCRPWYFEDKALLLGDAAHAIVPFYGQGMNAGFEDCRILEDHFDRYESRGEMFREFSENRKPNADAIAELALRNFVEMRDKTADPKFLLQKRIERRLAEQYPDRWIPLYSQVTFTHIPYAQALEQGERQEAIMQRIMQKEDIEEQWDSKEVAQDALQRLEKIQKE